MTQEEYLVYCRDNNNPSDTHHSSVPANSPEQAAELGLAACRAAWGWDTPDTDEAGDIVCVGVIRKSDCCILLWNEEECVYRAGRPPKAKSRKAYATIQFDLELPPEIDSLDLDDITFAIPLQAVQAQGTHGIIPGAAVLGYTTTAVGFVDEEEDTDA
jgi:hypothetical protein